MGAMNRAFRLLGMTAISLLISGSLAALETEKEGPVSVLVVGLVPTDSAVSAQVNEKLSEFFWAEISSLPAFRTLPAGLIDALAKRGSVNPDVLAKLSNLQDLLQSSIAQYQHLEFSQALSMISEARKQALLHPFSLESERLLPEIYLYEGVVLLSLKKNKQSAAAFDSLLRLRPVFAIDEVMFPPEVVRLFKLVRTRIGKEKQATASFSSSPPFATVMMDGQPQGDTPLVIRNIPSGIHRFELRRDGHLRWQGQLKLVAGRSLRKKITLKENPLPRLQGLVHKAVQLGKAKADTMVVAAHLAKTLGADFTLLGVVFGSPTGYLVGAALISARGEPAAKLNLCWIDSNLLNAPTALHTLAGDIARQAPTRPVLPTDIEKKILAAWRQPLDFDSYLFGLPTVAKSKEKIQPGSLLTTLPPATGPEAALPRGDEQAIEPAESQSRWHQSWWFWTAAAVVVGGGVATTLLILNGGDPIQDPDQVRIDVTLNPPRD